jgi:ribosomal protein S17
MTRTIVIRRDFLHYVRKYNRFEKRHKNMSVHLSPCFRYVIIIIKIDIIQQLILIGMYKAVM